MSGCCNQSDGGKTSQGKQGARRILAWLLPSAGLALVPKCPACLAAYVTLWTGLGLTYSEAAWLRWGLLLVFACSLFTLIVLRLDRWRILAGYFKQETGSCNTRS
jgi:hypothetical protein